ncbi:hypothetical protein ACJ73_03781 [Blastomyces percursus]|uniref:Uncharacterized protein n=1 Tax=Blastomyces percursus TaxID=1658174 RepID=A0A1J9Q7U4_9EURO|nr:hypothetical protein ACJ73_03781 [Blastomyces percursus]
MPPTSAGSARPPKERLGTPAYFDASNLTLYPSRLGMLAKLYVDGDAIGSLTNQGWYVNGRLKDRAKQRFHPWMEACEPSLRTPENIFKHLVTLFKDTAIQQKALDWLQSARQRNTPLTTFIPDFDTKILEAGGQLWEDRMKISMLKKALSFELPKTLVSVEEATTYEAFCIQLRRLDDRLTKLKSIQVGGEKRYTLIANTPAAKDNPDAMDWVDSNTYAQARVSAAPPNYRVPGLTPEEGADRRRRELGFKAGERLAPVQTRRQEPEEVGQQLFEEKMSMDAILVPTVIDRFDGPRDVRTHYMVKLDIDVGGHQRENAYAYENILLDARNRALIFPNGDRVLENDVHSTMELKQISANAYELFRKSSRRNRTKQNRIAIYSASLADIKKALGKLTTTARADPRTKLPRHYHECLPKR